MGNPSTVLTVFSTVLIILSALPTIATATTSQTIPQTLPTQTTALVSHKSSPPSPSFTTATLYGRIVAPAGWGLNPSTATSPGPMVTVSAGQLVSMEVASGDGAPHSWGVDVNNACTTTGCTTTMGDPISPSFSTTTLVNFTFTAPTRPGNYTYWCFVHFGAMHGTFQVKPQGILYGRILNPAGWAHAANNVTSPGPTVTVTAGQSVSMQLASADGILGGHNWGVDLNNACDVSGCTITTGDPISQTFATTTLVTFIFTAPLNPGNYTYWCFIHFGAMHGTFQVKPQPHDVSASSFSLSRNFAYRGANANPIKVNVTARNLGSSTENLAVFAQANATKANTVLIGNQTITLGPGANMIITFNWNTATLLNATYILTANVTRVNGETAFTNNIVQGGLFKVRVRGDVNNDCTVDISDLSGVGAQFGKISTSVGFNPFTDLNNDGVIDILDLVLVSSNFGHGCSG